LIQSAVKKVLFLPCFSKHRNVPPNCASSSFISSPFCHGNGFYQLSAANDYWGKTFKTMSGETEMTRQLSIITGCSAGATESFVVVPFELVKIKYVHSFLFSALSDLVTTKLFVGCKTRPWRAPTTALSTSYGRSSARTASSDCMPVWRRHFGGTWSFHGVGVGEALLTPSGAETGTYGGTAATSERSSKSRRCFRKRRFVTSLRCI